MSKKPFAFLSSLYPLNFREHWGLASAPIFAQLASGSPRFGSFLLGAVLSLLTMASLVTLMNHVGNVQRSAAWQRAFNRVSEGYWTEHSLDLSETAALIEASGNEVSTINPLTRHRIVLAAGDSLKQHYFDLVVAQRTADALLAHEKNGDDDGATSTTDFAKLITVQMRGAADDHDLEMLYSTRPIPERTLGPPAASAAYREQMQRINCAFEKVEVLPRNIGYIKLNAFPNPSVCHDTIIASMAYVNEAHAVIFDLRDNRGGFDMGSSLAAYFFDHPEYWYSPIQNTTRESWTHSPVPGSKLADKPVYVLTSSRTISAAEQFAYNMKMLKRAILVGETTAGAAHAANFHGLGENFYLGIVEVKSINPYSKYDWNGTGVEPDVKVSAADALNRAVGLARLKRGK